MARKYAVKSIDAWSDGDGGWTWNDSRVVGHVSFAKFPHDADVVKKLKDEGFLKDHVELIPGYGKRQRSRRAGKPFVRVDDVNGMGELIEIQDAFTHEPIFALEAETDSDEDFDGAGCSGTAVCR